MALLAEEIVEEWLNRQGYFTIRGIKLGVQEIDLLAIKVKDQAVSECRHLEVQASINPISYISRVPKQVQKEKQVGANSNKKRSAEDLEQGVREWVEKKFDLDVKKKLMAGLVNASWTRELVVHKVAYPEELEAFKKAGVKVIALSSILDEMKDSSYPISKASGADFIDLIQLSKT